MDSTVQQEEMVRIVNHPSAHVLLTECRGKTTGPEVFADRMRRIGHILAFPVLANLKTKTRWVETPLNVDAEGADFDGRVALVPIMRAGAILLDGFRAFLRNPLIWHFSVARDHRTLEPQIYGVKAPDHVSNSLQKVVVLEIMLATGGSATTTITILKERGAKNIVFVCVVAAPEGIARLTSEHPDVPIYTVAIDERLTGEGEFFPHGYIVPGLGDAGDRIFPLE
ncbi:uracil phosphoribosyltransferase [Candidatus Parcubacteria bacterium]|nr:uracil phosphoribosyltransferase [Candidatus Parcubacteria bacterium]